MTTDRRQLMSAARRLLTDRADAEDAVQDTFVRSLTAVPDPFEPPPAWLYTVLRNLAIDHLRRKQLEVAHRDVEAPLEESSEARLERRGDCEAALRHLLSRVSPTEAAAMLLRDVFEFEYAEISRMLGKSEIAARQFLHRARARIRRTDQPTDAEEPYVALCWRAIEARDPALLMHILQVTTSQAPTTSVSVGCDLRPRSSSMLVHVNGRYAIALVLDGIVLCVVPVGTQASSVGEPA